MTKTETRVIEIALKYEGILIATASFATITDTNPYPLLCLDNLKADSTVTIKAQSTFALKILVGKVHYTQINIIVINDVIITPIANNSCFGISSDSELRSYDQFELDLIRSWNN